MRVGNRKLNYKTGGNTKMTMLFIVDHTLNLFTLGFWSFLGFSHNFLWKHVDERIFWGRPDKIKTKKKDGDFPDAVVWVPENDGLGQFKIKSVHIGVQGEIIKALLNILKYATFSLTGPLSAYYEHTHVIPKMEFGRGRFCVIHPGMIDGLNKHAKSKKEPHPPQPADQYLSVYPVYGQPAREGHLMYNLKLEFRQSIIRLACVYYAQNLVNLLTCKVMEDCWKEIMLFHLYNKSLFVNLIPIPQPVQTVSTAPVMVQPVMVQPVVVQPVVPVVPVVVQPVVMQPVVRPQVTTSTVSTTIVSN